VFRFTQLSGEVEKLDYANATAAGRKITSLIQALQDVEEFHQIETNLQVKQFLADTRGYLTKMIRTANVRHVDCAIDGLQLRVVLSFQVRDRILADLDIISDLSYAWEIIGDFTPLIHQVARFDRARSIRHLFDDDSVDTGHSASKPSPTLCCAFEPLSSSWPPF